MIFTSDNGPWLSKGDAGGHAPLRSGKGTGFEGGAGSMYYALAGEFQLDPFVRRLLHVDLLPSVHTNWA